MLYFNVVANFLPVTLLIIMSIAGCHSQKEYGIVDVDPDKAIHIPTPQRKSRSNIRSAKYYFQLGKQKMESKEYEASNFYLKKLTEQFPNSPLISEATTYLTRNNKILLEVKDMFDKVMRYQQTGRYEESNRFIDFLSAKHPYPDLIEKVRVIKQENLVRQGLIVLKILEWDWSDREYSFEYQRRNTVIKGKVKNMSNANLAGLEVAAILYDQNRRVISRKVLPLTDDIFLPNQICDFEIVDNRYANTNYVEVEFQTQNGLVIPLK